MKQKLLLFAFTLIGTMLFSQSSIPRAFEAWKTKDGTQTLYVKNATKTDGSGNVYTAGATLNSSNGTYDIFLVKKNSSGVTLYTKQINGTANSHDFVAGMYLSGTDVYITGSITNSVTSTPELFIAKYNSSGTQQFFTTYSNGYGDVGKDIVLNATYNYIIVTGASMNNIGDTDASVIAFNSSGVQQWVNFYDHAGGNDGGFKITTRNQLCTITAPVTISANNYKLASVSYSVSNGWQSGSVTTGATATSSVEIVTDVVTDGSGNMYICGATQQNAGQGYDMYIAKVTNSLTISWETTYNANSLDDFAKGIAIDGSGQLWVTGVTTHSTQGKNITTLRINSSGVIQSTLTVNGSFNGNDEGMDVVIDASNNAYIACYQTLSATNSDFYTIKYNSSATQIWEKFTDGYSQLDQATNIALDSLNNVIVAGSSEISVGSLVYLTTQLVQQDVKDPVDLLNQPTNKNYGYHENRGQVRNDTGGVAPSVLYYTHNQYPKIYIEKDAYNYIFTATDTVYATNDTIERIQVNFASANTNVRPYAYNPKTYPLHYFLGQVGEPITEVRGNDRVVTQNIYPQIDLHYYSNSKGFKYYFVVKEGGDPRDIQFNIDGVTSTTITSSNLVINGVLGSVTLKQPYAYMVDGAGATTTLSASNWSHVSGNNYELSTPSYTTSQSLVIVIETVNPASVTGSTANLDYSTYYGKGNNDIFNDIRVASNGDRYVVGNTDGNTFPVVKGLFTYQGQTDAVVLRFEVTKDSCAFATYYGGAGAEVGNSVDINSLGEIFIGGKTNGTGASGIPTYSISGASNQTFNGSAFAPSGADSNDGFIARFAPNGNGFTWGRYVGGSQADGINAIYIDNSNNLYYTGFARSNNMPTTAAAQASLSVSNPTVTNIDAIVGKFNSSLSYVYSTYLGGGTAPTSVAKDEGRDITVDGSGNAIVVGLTESNGFPVNNSTGNSNTFYDASFGGYRDGFIARYSPTGTKQFASYFGGNGTYGFDEITRVNYNATKDEIYIAGQSNDTVSFPYVNLSGAFNRKNYVSSSNNVAFIASMTGNLTKQWCSNYGKTSACNFSVTGLASDNAGIIYLSGQAKSNTLNYPASTPTLTVYKDTVRNGDDGFVTIFNPQKNLFHAHYLGGTGNDYINNAYVGTNNKLYVVGNTGSTDYPIAYNSVNIQFIDSTFGGGSGQNDGFITRFDMGTIQIISVKETSKDDYLLNVYPNPSTSGFILEMKDDELKNVQAKVYSITGQLIVEQKITQTLTKFHCESWANGVYLINVNADGKLKTFKLIKN